MNLREGSFPLTITNTHTGKRTTHTHTSQPATQQKTLDQSLTAQPREQPSVSASPRTGTSHAANKRHTTTQKPIQILLETAHGEERDVPRTRAGRLPKKGTRWTVSRTTRKISRATRTTSRSSRSTHTSKRKQGATGSTINDAAQIR